MAHQEITIGEATRIAHIRGAAVLAFGKQVDLLDDFARRIHLQQAPGIAFADKRVAVREALAGVDRARRFVREDHLLGDRDLFHPMARVE